MPYAEISKGCNLLAADNFRSEIITDNANNSNNSDNGAILISLIKHIASAPRRAERSTEFNQPN